METGQPSPEWRRQQIVMALSIVGGFLGMDRFYQQQLGWGILKLITFGGFGIWWLIDAIYYTVQAGERPAASS